MERRDERDIVLDRIWKEHERRAKALRINQIVTDALIVVLLLLVIAMSFQLCP